MKLQNLLYIILIRLHICDAAHYRGTFLLSISQNSVCILDGGLAEHTDFNWAEFLFHNCYNFEFLTA